MKLSTDQTSYSQSLAHLVKGNLGVGVLGMGSSFAHLGLAGAMITVPSLCFLSCYCVLLLIKSAECIEPAPSSRGSPSADRSSIDYPGLARRGIANGPKWMRMFSKPLGQMVETALLAMQIGACCVYIVFVAENITSVSFQKPKELLVFSEREGMPTNN